MIKKIIKDNKYFYYPYLCLILCSLPVLLVKEKGFLTIVLNSNHTLVMDYFFKYFTYSGTGFLLTPLLIFLYFKYRMISYYFLFNYAINGLLTFVLKRYLIIDNFRPYWELKRTFHKVDGVEIKKLFSMPSGHANMAFLICLGLCFFTKDKTKHLVLFLVASLVAFSRLYLYQHFFIDTIIGSAMAVVITTGSYVFFLNKRWIK